MQDYNASHVTFLDFIENLAGVTEQEEEEYDEIESTPIRKNNTHAYIHTCLHTYIEEEEYEEIESTPIRKNTHTHAYIHACMHTYMHRGRGV
jgi:hypothetical protein